MTEQELRTWAVERHLEFVNTVNSALTDGPWLPTKGDIVKGADEIYQYAAHGTIPEESTS